MKGHMDESEPKGEMDATFRRLLTAPEVAEWLGVHVKTVYQWAEEGKLPCIKIGNLLRFEFCEMSRWLQARRKVTECRSYRRA